MSRSQLLLSVSDFLFTSSVILKFMGHDHISTDCDWLAFSRQATSRSLCLLDEFGKGTLTEGLLSVYGLTCSLLCT